MKDQQQFPKEISTDKVKLRGNKIICKGRVGTRLMLWDAIIEVSQVEEIYLEIIDEELSALYLVDGHFRGIPTCFKGFAKVYRQLSAQFHLDDTLFFDSLQKKEPGKTGLWRKIHPGNYQFLESGNADYTKGFEVLAKEPVFIAWDQPFKTLLRQHKKLVFRGDAGYSFCFKYPVRVGNVLFMQGLSFPAKPDRVDIPPLKFYMKCYDAKNSVQSFVDLQSRLRADLGEEKKEVSESEKHLFVSLHKEDIYFALTFFQDEGDYGFRAGYTLLNISNNRPYLEVLEDPEYEAVLAISDALIMEASLRMAGGYSAFDYRKNPRIKNRYKKIEMLESGKPVIWRDDRNKKIGFACGKYAQVFTQREITGISIQNVLPAKGGGFAELILHFRHRTQNEAIFSGVQNIFDAYAEKIEKVTGKEVGFMDEFYNC